MALQTLYRKARSLPVSALICTILIAGPTVSPGLAERLSGPFPRSVACATSGTTSRPASDPASWPEMRIARTFARMTPAAAVRLAETHPTQVAALDGAPPAVRYTANALLAGPAYAGRKLLLFDRSGTGRMIEVLGDVNTARRIAVLVPGVDNRLADFDRGLGGVQRRAPAWQARQLRAVTGPDVAVVAWLGYQPPSGVNLDAVRSERARRGADELLAFVRGLAVQAPQATLTIVGHSYGSLVAGYAARRLPPDVTDIVTIGSPGLDFSSCRDLHTQARVWAGSSASDWTHWLPDLRILGLGHGRKPSEPEFGARTLDVADADGHDGYYVPGTKSLASIARVVAAGS